jgi:diguanylate cyclase (GGDEF)-like protein
MHSSMFVYLDQFKVINDACGHLAGDRLLSIVGDRLLYCIKEQCPREESSVYRYGGDEFAVLLNGINKIAL